MKRILTSGAVAAALVLNSFVLAHCAMAGNFCGACDPYAGCPSWAGCHCGVMWPLRRAQCYSWNRNYAHSQYGQPIALVVPPTATLQSNWGWGVSSFRMSRLDHQFGRNYPGPGPYGGPFKNTPRWPQDTNQFGVYYVRGPW